MRLIKFPTTSEEKIQTNIRRLREQLWESENGAHVIEVLQLAEEYMLGLDDTLETNLAVINLQSSIIILSSYLKD